MLSIITIAAAAASFLVPLVNAHGYVQDLKLGSTPYSAWLPFTDPYNSPVPQRISRKVKNDSPVLDIHSSTLACNVDGEDPAPLAGDIQAGSTLSFKWNTWPSDHIGPITVYLAACPTDDCSTLPSSAARWFPIDKRGLNGGTWFTPEFIAAGATLTTTIPPGLKPGGYLARMEIVALHSTGAPQFYPSCTQIRVSGSGNDGPSDSELVSIPGLYDGHAFPDVWSNPTQYTLAGPAVPGFAAAVNPSGPSSGGGGGGGAVPAPPPPPASAPPTNGDTTTPSTSVAPPTTTDGAGNAAPGIPGTKPGGNQSVCKLKRRKAAELRKRASLLNALPAAHRRFAGRRRTSF